MHERSLFVPLASFEDVHDLARRYEQETFIWGDRGRWCEYDTRTGEPYVRDGKETCGTDFHVIGDDEEFRQYSALRWGRGTPPRKVAGRFVFREEGEAREFEAYERGVERLLARRVPGDLVWIRPSSPGQYMSQHFPEEFLIVASLRTPDNLHLVGATTGKEVVVPNRAVGDLCVLASGKDPAWQRILADKGFGNLSI